MTEKEQPDTRATFWADHIKTWQDSGQSQLSYCREQQINYHRFIYWRRKAINPSPGSSKPSGGFVPVTLCAGRQEELTITFPGGATLEGIEPGNLGTVCQLLNLIR